jgi:hypothetical protein
VLRNVILTFNNKYNRASAQYNETKLWYCIEQMSLPHLQCAVWSREHLWFSVSASATYAYESKAYVSVSCVDLYVKNGLLRTDFRASTANKLLFRAPCLQNAITACQTRHTLNYWYRSLSDFEFYQCDDGNMDVASNSKDHSIFVCKLT